MQNTPLNELHNDKTMTTTNQIKNFFFLFKREDFTDPQFNDYWLKHHTSLAQQVDPSIHRIIVPNFYQEPDKSNGFGSALSRPITAMKQR